MLPEGYSIWSIEKRSCISESICRCVCSRWKKKRVCKLQKLDPNKTQDLILGGPYVKRRSDCRSQVDNQGRRSDWKWAYARSDLIVERKELPGLATWRCWRCTKRRDLICIHLQRERTSGSFWIGHRCNKGSGESCCRHRDPDLLWLEKKKKGDRELFRLVADNRNISQIRTLRFHLRLRRSRRLLLCRRSRQINSGGSGLGLDPL